MIAEPLLISSELRIRDLGLMPYEEAYQIQKNLVFQKRRNSSLPDELLFVEHPAVYTYGRKSQGNETSAPEVDGVFIERGGEATFHNPGQLVCYPILKLGAHERDIIAYLRHIEQSVVELLAEFGITGTRRDGATGVWLPSKNQKIASVGVAVSGWVTYHGWALNVHNDLNGFHRIRPCGFAPNVMTSMEKVLGAAVPPLDKLKDSYITIFKERLRASSQIINS